MPLTTSVRKRTGQRAPAAPRRRPDRAARRLQQPRRPRRRRARRFPTTITCATTSCWPTRRAVSTSSSSGVDGRLDYAQGRQIEAFARDYLGSRAGRASRSPCRRGRSTTLAAERTLIAVRRTLLRNGVRNGISIVSPTRSPTRRSPRSLHLSYVTLQARPTTRCGDWPDDLGSGTTLHTLGEPHLLQFRLRQPADAGGSGRRSARPGAAACRRPDRRPAAHPRDRAAARRHRSEHRLDQQPAAHRPGRRLLMRSSSGSP